VTGFGKPAVDHRRPETSAIFSFWHES